MRHKYMKSLLLAAVALLGFAVPSFAQEEAVTATILFETDSYDNDFSGQDIRLGWIYTSAIDEHVTTRKGELKRAPINSTQDDYVMTWDGTEDEYPLGIYFSINGYEDESFEHFLGNTRPISIFLRKLRFNYTGSTPTTIPVTFGDSELTLDLNKDYYFPCKCTIYETDGEGEIISTIMEHPILTKGEYQWESEEKEFQLNQDLSIDLFKLHNLTIKTNVPEQILNERAYWFFIYSKDSYGNWKSCDNTKFTGEWSLTLKEGTYKVSLGYINGPNFFEIASQEYDLTSDKTVNFNNVCIVTVKVVEPDGTPVEGIVTSLGVSDANGEAYTIVAKDTELSISASNYWDEQKYTITGDKTITLTIPKVISIRAKYNGQTISYTSADAEQYSKSRIYLYAGDSDYGYTLEINEDGTFSGRAEANREYRISFGFNGYVSGHTANSILVTDGTTLRIGKFSTKADGVGLDFFMGNGSSLNYESEYGYYNVLVGGTPVRIAAVPVGNEQFTCWDINGHQYSNPMIDFTPKEDATVATAKFTGTIANQVKSVAGQNAETIYVTVEGSYLVLPADVEAEAAIYAMDGKLTKKTGVVGNRLYIGNLPDGAYVLVLTVDGRRQTATFVTK